MVTYRFKDHDASLGNFFAVAYTDLIIQTNFKKVYFNIISKTIDG